MNYAITFLMRKVYMVKTEIRFRPTALKNCPDAKPYMPVRRGEGCDPHKKRQAARIMHGPNPV